MPRSAARKDCVEKEKQSDHGQDGAKGAEQQWRDPGRQFDEAFRNLAERYWLGLSAAERRKAWGS